MQEIISKRFETFTSLEHYDFNVIEHKHVEDETYFLGPSSLAVYDRKGHFNLKQKHHTKEVFDSNFKNPIFNLFHRRLTGVVAKNEDKVTLKFFLFSRNRRVDEKFVRISTNCAYMTYNFKRNALYVGTINNYHKKRKVTKSVKIFTFTSDIVNDLLSKFMTWHNFVCENTPVNLAANNGYSFNELVKHFIDNIPGVNYDSERYSTKTIYKTILTKKNIKLCDNWGTFCGAFPQPKSKDFKKYGDRYLTSIMELNKLSGDKIKRVLHKVKKFNPELFRKAVSFFGNDYILGKKDEELQLIFESDCNPYYTNLNFQNIHSKKERNCIFEIFKLMCTGEIDVNTFSDHFIFYNSLKNFENIKWTSTTYDEFREEHLNWTEMNEFYTKGTFRRIYNEKFEDEVLKPIFMAGVTYYPVLIKDSTEYNDESFVQSNCVKGYIKRPEAMIISLRKDSPQSKERATIEFRISFDTVIEIKRVQTLGRFNKTLTDDWTDVLNRLDKRIDDIVHLFETPKIHCKIGYNEFQSDSKFVENIFKGIKRNYSLYNYSNYDLVWEDNRVNNINENPVVRGLLDF